MIQGSNPSRGKKISPNFPNRLWNLPSFLSYGYRCSFLVIQRPGREVDIHHYLALWLRMSGAIPLLPIRLDGLDRDVLILAYSSTSIL
jgi:hypothetical protein